MSDESDLSTQSLLSQLLNEQRQTNEHLKALMAAQRRAMQMQGEMMADLARYVSAALDDDK